MTKRLIFGFMMGLALAQAQMDPAKREAAEAERLKILRAADLMDSVQAESERLQVEFNTLKEQFSVIKSQLETQSNQNEKLRSDMVTLRAALEKAESQRVQEREVLLKEIGQLVAEKLKSVEAPKREIEKPVKPVAEKPVEKSKKESKEEGFYHVVEHGQTLSAISQAFRESGVNVSVDDIRKANGMSSKDMIKSGQKLFIPKK